MGTKPREQTVGNSVHIDVIRVAGGFVFMRIGNATVA
jgi:hypothetical protein